MLDPVVTLECRVQQAIEAYFRSPQAQAFLLGQPGLSNPPGAIVAYGGSTAPRGWLLCSGLFVSKQSYDQLFSAIGHKFNGGTDPGDGTFKLPALANGQGPVAPGTGVVGGTTFALGASGGEDKHALITAELALHNHGVTDPGHAHAQQGSTGGAAVANTYQNFTGTVNFGGNFTAASTTGITIQNSGSGTAHNNMQPFVVVNFIIKY